MTNSKAVNHVDMNSYQLLNALLHLINGNPASPTEGQIWYDTAAHKLKFRDASANIDPTARANHSGTQVASTISDLATVVQAYRLDQFAAPNVDLPLGSHKITGLTAGTATGHAVEYDQMNAAIAASVLANITGLTWKETARVATTANIASLAGGAPNSLDGISLAASDRILVKNQSTAAQNGIYVVSTLGTGSNGTWNRSADANSAAELQGGVMVAVDEGTAGNNTVWMITQDVTTVGTDAVTWTQFGAGGTTYTASLGVQLVGSDFRANLGTGLTLSGNTIVPDYTGTNIMKRKVATGYVGTSGTDITVNHAFALATKEDLIVKVYEVGVGEVICGVAPTDTNNVVLSFGTTPTTNQYRYSMIGLT